MWKIVASYLAKHKARRRAKYGQAIITGPFAEVEGECWQDE
jgi:hypothetical protein